MKQVEILYSETIEHEKDIEDIQRKVNNFLAKLSPKAETKLTWFMEEGRMYCIVEWCEDR
jgi:hypothetical protein